MVGEQLRLPWHSFMGETICPHPALPCKARGRVERALRSFQLARID